MIQKAKKRTLFLVGLLVGGLAGVFGGHLKASYSKEGSLLSSVTSVAYADAGSAWSGDGCCGGCCGTDSDSGGSATDSSGPDSADSADGSDGADADGAGGAGGGNY